MSMSTHVTAFRDMDGKFKAMIEMKEICDQKGFSYPNEVVEYFGNAAHESPEYAKETKLHVSVKGWVKEWSHADPCSGKGYEIDVKDIPKDVKTIRFYNAW